jgi:hypothetical protein
MRLVLTTALVLISGTAFGSSITVMSGTAVPSPSLVEQHCSDCQAGKPKADTSSYHVPLLKSGTQKTEIVEINGEKRLVRTEAWLGGSPVIHISKLPEWLKNDKAIANVSPSSDGSTETGIEGVVAPSDGIDLEATTSALQAPQIAEVAAPTPLAVTNFELRLPNGN